MGSSHQLVTEHIVMLKIKLQISLRRINFLNKLSNASCKQKMDRNAGRMVTKVTCDSLYAEQEV